MIARIKGAERIIIIIIRNKMVQTVDVLGVPQVIINGPGRRFLNRLLVVEGDRGEEHVQSNETSISLHACVRVHVTYIVERPWHGLTCTHS